MKRLDVERYFPPCARASPKTPSHKRRKLSSGLQTLAGRKTHKAAEVALSWVVSQTMGKGMRRTSQLLQNTGLESDLVDGVLTISSQSTLSGDTAAENRALIWPFYLMENAP